MQGWTKCRMLIVWRKGMWLGREKEDDSASTSARQRALYREERWGKAVRKSLWQEEQECK